MESDDGASSSTGVFIPVPVNSDVFHSSILTQLQSSYLFEESKNSFVYTSAYLIKNPTLEDRYNAYREKRREQGYSDSDLRETYGFLLFDQLNKAKLIGETGLLAENGTCTTLGDPTKGVYLSMYSDCLDLNCWYHGKSGYITIVKITEGKVKKVSENYTQNVTEPTVGYDCHVSEQLQSVSSKTSSFLAFERTQYYLYEFLDNGRTALSPSLACPYAVVAFSYRDDNKVKLETKQDNCEDKVACPYSPWSGKLQIGAQTFNIGIRSTSAALTWTKLPPVIKVEWAISMLVFKKLLPKAIFDSTFTQQGHICCSLCEIVALTSEENEQLSSLLLEIKKQDIALVIGLSDRGFLVLIHDSSLITGDKGTATNIALQGVFMFSESQIIQRDTKIEQLNRSLPSDALRVLPLLIYAEGAIKKASIRPNKDICDMIVQQMHSHVTLISPDLSLSSFQEVDFFPDQYDVLVSHQHLYSTPEWTETQWQSLKSYLSNANSFQLPLGKASEILAAGQGQEDLEDDIYIHLSSPEEASTSLISTESECREDWKCSTPIATSQESTQPFSPISHSLVPCVLSAQEVTSEMFASTTEKCEGDETKETKKMPLTTDEHSEELIVSITSAAPAVDREALDVIKPNQFSVTAKLQEATLNTFSEIVQSKITLNISDANVLLTKSENLHQELNLESTSTAGLQMDIRSLKKNKSICLDHLSTQEPSPHIDGCEIQRNEQDIQSPTPKKEKTVSMSLTDNALLKELETCTLRKKSERWGLKPVVSTCGRIFIPYGSVESKEIRFLQEKLHLTEENNDPPEEMIVDAQNDVSHTTDHKQQMSNTGVKELTKATEDLTSKSGQMAKYDMKNGTDSLTKEDHTKNVPSAKQSKLFRKLKSVILKKRKIDALKMDLTISGTEDHQLDPKRVKNDLIPQTIPNINDKSTQGSSVDFQHVLNRHSVDPLFAHALGLTPKRASNIKTDSSGAEETSVAKERSPCKLQNPSSTKGASLKMLKKHQNLSADQVKKKWWLHFQTPACYAEKQNDISVRKINHEKTSASSEALNLLAELALSANKEQVSSQACDFKENLKKWEDVTNPEEPTVLHALLLQPATKSILPQELSSPIGFGDTGLVDLIYQEHAYSLPSSPSLPLVLPAPFQVSPLNGSSRLLHALRQCDGPQLMPPVSPGHKVEQNKRAPRDPKRHWYRSKFCLLRTIENKDKTVHVTRHWKEEYNFKLDSRFTVDSMDKTIIRALHGPWDSSIHDTNEEVQLIVHMWIGLFYSRSTARIFHFDSDVTFPSSEKNVLDAKEVYNETRTEPSAANIVHSPLLKAADRPDAQVLDLSKPRNCVINTKEVSSNLSQKSSSVNKGNQNPEISTQELIVKTQIPDEVDTLNPQGLPSSLPIQFYLNLMQAAGVSPHLKYVGIPLSQNNGISSEVFIPVWNGNTYPNLWTNNAQTPSLTSLESSESHRTVTAPENLPTKPELQDNCKRQRKKKIQRNAPPSAVSNIKESHENASMHAKYLPNSNTSTDQSPTNKDARSNNLLDIKKKYMEKMKAASSQVDQKEGYSSPQNDRGAGQCILLKKLLREDPSVKTKLQSLSKFETDAFQNTKLNIAYNENPSVDQKPKVTTSDFNISAPLVVSNDLKTSHLSACQSSLQERNEQFSAKDSHPTCQDLSMIKEIAVGENPIVFKDLSQDECVKPTESHETMHTFLNDNGENRKYCDVNSLNTINTPFEDKSVEQTSSQVAEQGYLTGAEQEDMEVVPSSEVMASQSTFTGNARYDGHSQHGEQLVAGNEATYSSNVGDSESDDRSPTPTIDEQPYVYTNQQNFDLDANFMNDTSQDIAKKEPSPSVTPELNAFNCDTKANVGFQSDIELRTFRTLKCLDEYLNTSQSKSLSVAEDTSNSPETLIYNPKDDKTSSSSVGDSCHLEVKYISPFKDVLGNMLQLRQKRSTYESASAPDRLNEDDSCKLSSSRRGDSDQDLSICHNKLKTTPDCNTQSIKFSMKKKRHGGFVCNGPIFEAHQQNEKYSNNFVPSNCKYADQQQLQNNQLLEAISSTVFKQPAQKNSVLQVAHDPNILVPDKKTGAEDLLNYSTSFVDSKTNTITDDSLGTQGSLSCTVSNTGKKISSFLEKISKRCLQNDPTQSSMDRECLIFWDKMKQVLKRRQDQGAHCDQSILSSSCPITVQFSHLLEQDDALDDIGVEFVNQKISVDMSDKEPSRDFTQQRSNPEALEQPGVSAITAQCTQQYRDIMNKICSETRNASLRKDLHKTDIDDSTANSSNYFDFCSQMKREMDDSFHNNLNSVVKKSCKTKNRFFLLFTSDDEFFKKTQEYLEAEGHIAVEPSDFFTKQSSSLPLLVIVRNEDIAGHIFKIPHLLELRKSAVVQFAGIDEPDDVLNLTYQELLIKGGFVMFDAAAVESLSPGDIKKISEILQRLGQTSKWKWVLHYRDSRRLKENARLCPKAKEKTNLLNKCKDDGLLDILPYHECDLVSRQEPNYRQCVCHQQVQNISSRYPVFVTDSEMAEFERNGILTMTVSSFLMGSLSNTINGIT